MFTCPNPDCGAESRRLVLPHNGRLGCEACRTRPVSSFDPRLHQTYASDGKTRLTFGKAGEIASRVVSKDDGKTVINRHTGRETQY